MAQRRSRAVSRTWVRAGSWGMRDMQGSQPQQIAHAQHQRPHQRPHQRRRGGGGAGAPRSGGGWAEVAIATLAPPPFADRPRLMSPPEATAPSGDAWTLTFRALGANPTPIDIKELYPALQQGVVDGQENPYDNMLVRKFYRGAEVSLEHRVTSTTGPATW